MIGTTFLALLLKLTEETDSVVTLSSTQAVSSVNTRSGGVVVC